MTPWISARRADAFESKVSEGRGSADQHPGDPDQSLVDLVAQVRAVPQSSPRPDFVANLRETLLLEAAEVLTTQPSDDERRLATRLSLPARDPRRQRRLVAVVGSVVLVGTGGTMAMAAQGAMPGEGLYPIKRLVESARSQVTFSDTSRGEQLLARASSRLDEVDSLLDDGSTGRLALVPDTLGDFISQAHEGADVLLEDWSEGGSQDSVAQVRAFAAESLDRLGAWQGRVPESAEQTLRDAAEAMVQLDASAGALCPDCGEGIATLPQLLSGPPLTLPSATPTTPTPPASPPTISGLPSIDPDLVTPPTAVPSQSPAAPQASQPTAGVSVPGTPGTAPAPTTQPSAGPSQAPTQAPPSAEPSSGGSGGTGGSGGGTKPTPVKDLTEALLGDGQTGEGSTPGVVPSLVGGVVGVVDGLLSSLTGTPKP